MASRVLHRVAQAVQRTDAGIAAPREDQLGRAAHADHLVVDQVGGHPDEREVAPPLPDDLVTGGKRDEVREALHDQRVAVVHDLGDAFGQRHDLSHVASS